MNPKFKIWSFIHKKFIDIYSMDSNGNWVQLRETNEILINTESKQFEMLLYTGLKDIHKREIFEGDYIKYLVKTSEKEYDTSIGEVWFEDATFLFDRDLEYSTCDFNFKWRTSLEIIGNIYETPNLTDLIKI